ncbi:hypothetical protein [Loigolactobacillus backii]|uniref:Uncharacterized protein n=2 Tax=Loigolactobacillus backii TaxID=375175 RepID=A0A192H1G5_9LACO|nr:hypothetical protein [Loigolactobacillus backii]ANK60645.1 hypothetical protein AYR52_10515 [Loigolactobacillus backii]ANK61786.1 hypothetical protein AYR53_02795 [Loigolactobacillus backii]ANK65598.1 hypothetical protein AYR54_10320 [Loigolactobacillus backii]ANK68070.1 hypothetical protein AYR55_10440 [Loigolactobacillus backii]ANK69020.1 hypothetical protein AYR56_01925 [Loigolactobacillus backii]
MLKITHLEKQQFPPLEFIGRPYDNHDRQNGTFDHLWQQWFANDLFAQLRKENDPYSGGSAYGFINESAGHFSYWIGDLFDIGTPIPQGFESFILGQSSVGVAWVSGRTDNNELFGDQPMKTAFNALKKAKIAQQTDWEHLTYFFERYDDRRFDVHAKETILDYGFYLQDPDGPVNN